MKNLTKKEIALLPWNGGEKFSLVNREDKSMVYSAEDEETLKAALVTMTQKHPLYYKLQLVQRP